MNISKHYFPRTFWIDATEQQKQQEKGRLPKGTAIPHHPPYSRQRKKAMQQARTGQQTTQTRFSSLLIPE
ncbi:hypothetical protein [Stenotrophomonas humi]